MNDQSQQSVTKQ